MISPEQRDSVQGCIKEIHVAMTHIDSQQKQIKDVLDRIKSEFGIPVKQARHMAKAYHLNNFHEQSSEAELFVTLFETIFPHTQQ